jgi:hypothetical protein
VQRFYRNARAGPPPARGMVSPWPAVVPPLRRRPPPPRSARPGPPRRRRCAS